MFAPSDRTNLFEAILPPPGWEVEGAILTTYSVALHTAIALPAVIAFAAASRPETADRGRLAHQELAALRRLSGRITIFVQQASILDSGRLPPIVSEVEGMVREVTAPNGGSFHPKVWLLRFREISSAQTSMRLVISSRNLTSDGSWDMAIVLDGRPGRPQAGSAALPGFLRMLAGRCLRPLNAERRQTLEMLAMEAEKTAWILPPGIRRLTFRAIGVGKASGWTPPKSSRLAVISPFVDEATLNQLAASSREPFLLLTRRETLDTLSSSTVAFQRRTVLNSVGAQDEQDAASGDLHAKAFFWEIGERVFAAVGSANATSPARTGRNVEFMAEFDCGAALEGKGIAKLLEPSSLGLIIEDYETGEQDPKAPPVDLRPFRRALLDLKLYVRCDRIDDGWSLALVVEGPPPDHLAKALPGLRFRPVTLAEDQYTRCGVDLERSGRSAYFRTLSVEEVTGFLAFEAEPDGIPDRFVLNLEIRGLNEEERRTAVLRSVLPSENSFIDFVRLLLGDIRADGEAPFVGEFGSETLTTTAWASGIEGGLLELLIRCASYEPERLEAVQETLASLGDEGISSVAPASFLKLWSEFSQVARRTRKLKKL